MAKRKTTPPITERVTIITTIEERETKPFRQKLKKPVFTMRRVLVEKKAIYSTYRPLLSSRTMRPFSIVITLLPKESITPLLWVVRMRVVNKLLIFLRIWTIS